FKTAEVVSEFNHKAYKTTTPEWHKIVSVVEAIQSHERQVLKFGSERRN
ncbi:2763_t:CDS:1, partial [Ambispora leptoticha]